MISSGFFLRNADGAVTTSSSWGSASVSTFSNHSNWSAASTMSRFSELNARRPLRTSNSSSESVSLVAVHRVEHLVSALEQRPPLEEPCHDAAKRPGVDAHIIVSPPQRHLGGHVQQRAGLRVRRQLGRVHGEAEVADLDGPVVLPDEDVGGLDVPMDHAALMHPLRPCQQLPHRRAHCGLWQRRRRSLAATAALAAAQVVTEGRAADVLHEEAELRGGAVAREAVVADEEREAIASVEEAHLP
jgi:hypothetical protein